MALSKPNVLLFRDDFKRMENWVLQYPNSETGGQFFGLWANGKDPYINVVIGPGKNCRHGTHSFHQDIEYLKKTGTFLNQRFMTCHIGEWHSHHRLRIRQPSSGDLNSIWKHFPSGVEHFLLVIATIEDEGVELWPYLFTASSHEHKLIEYTIIEKDNVFMKGDNVKETIARGVENAPDKWFLTDWGAHFVQCLNSNLEKMVAADKLSTIEKHVDRKRQSTLQFSFYFRVFYCTITFPQDFPVADLTCKIERKDRKGLKEWKEKAKHSESLEHFAQSLLKLFHTNCITK